MPLNKDMKKLLIDVGITLLVFLGGILFLIFGPNPSALNFIILIGLFIAIPELIKRTFTYLTVKVYCAEEKLYIFSYLESREILYEDMSQLQIESRVDILKLHPLLTLFSSNSDFTTSLQRALSIRLPGEAIYLTVKNLDQDFAFIKERMVSDGQATLAEVVDVLPFYHWKNIKRLLGKLYFAITVKGISAYTGLFLILYFLDVSEWIMVVSIMLFWLFNLYISDRVLQLAMDAKETTNLEVKEVAQRIFSKAGVPNVKVYETDSVEYNGLATGMKIGRAMVTLTSATIKLPLRHIEGILAHEATHVKKRDVLWGQLLRLPYMLLVIGIAFLLIEYVENVGENSLLVFFLIWILIMTFPLYQAFYMQWMEVRADHLGAHWLDDGAEQMAESLRSLGESQDFANKKAMEYRVAEVDKEKLHSFLDRGSWIFRFLEFQFMPHPPMYWRIRTLENPDIAWKDGAIKTWLKDRIKESFGK